MPAKHYSVISSLRISNDPWKLILEHRLTKDRNRQSNLWMPLCTAPKCSGNALATFPKLEKILIYLTLKYGSNPPHIFWRWIECRIAIDCHIGQFSNLAGGQTLFTGYLCNELFQTTIYKYHCLSLSCSTTLQTIYKKFKTCPAI